MHTFEMGNVYNEPLRSANVLFIAAFLKFPLNLFVRKPHHVIPRAASNHSRFEPAAHRSASVVARESYMVMRLFRCQARAETRHRVPYIFNRVTYNVDRQNIIIMPSDKEMRSVITQRAVMVG
jgi:hypothetical protein